MQQGRTVKSRRQLERAVAKYEAKLAAAASPTRKRYAAGMLRMARAALAACDEAPAGGADVDDVVDLLPHEYSEL